MLIITDVSHSLVHVYYILKYTTVSLLANAQSTGTYIFTESKGEKMH